MPIPLRLDPGAAPAPGLEKRTREALATPGRPGIRSLPSGSALIHRQCSASAALSTAQASPRHSDAAHTTAAGKLGRLTADRSPLSGVERTWPNDRAASAYDPTQT